ncbi:unnamed protein product [Nyctereutes procyonoides]|uniref:Protein FAM136A n=1 Tax=Nyctereutes procyonoides TaxID=34880 RepID=A0A811YSZ2_NYCPR|nr:unnamed protein product [Nyctereutes procyonoides]
MAELEQLWVQEAVDFTVKSLERENIRKMQDSQVSLQQVHQCIECCHVPLAQAQAPVTSDAPCCNDKAKDSIDVGSKELQVKWQLESCVTKCVDDHTHFIPTMTKRMKVSLLSIGK